MACVCDSHKSVIRHSSCGRHVPGTCSSSTEAASWQQRTAMILTDTLRCAALQVQLLRQQHAAANGGAPAATAKPLVPASSSAAHHTSAATQQQAGNASTSQPNSPSATPPPHRTSPPAGSPLLHPSQAAAARHPSAEAAQPARPGSTTPATSTLTTSSSGALPPLAVSGTSQAGSGGSALSPKLISRHQSLRPAAMGALVNSAVAVDLGIRGKTSSSGTSSAAAGQQG